MIRPSNKRVKRFLSDFVRDHETPRWDDLRFPASGLNPPGLVSDPDINTDLGTLSFDASATNAIGGLAQMPHAWLEESEVRPHIHWIQPATGDVVWQLEYRVMQAVRAVFPPAWTTVTSTDVVSDYPGSGDWVQITRLPAIDMTGFLISSMILFRLSRLGGDVGDTLASPVDLLELDLHYLSTPLASREEFVK